MDLLLRLMAAPTQLDSLTCEYEGGQSEMVFSKHPFTDTLTIPTSESESAFPSLGAGAPVAKGQWGKKPHIGQGAAPSAPIWTGSAPVIQRAVFQETFTIPSSEDSSRLMKSVMARLQREYKNKDVSIEASSTRSATTFVVKGPKESYVKAARKEITVGLARNVRKESFTCFYECKRLIVSPSRLPCMSISPPR